MGHRSRSSLFVHPAARAHAPRGPRRKLRQFARERARRTHMPGRLIVHAGAHKTGTTTTQLFLHYYHVWIRDTFDIHIVPNGKWTNHCASAECDDVLAVAGLLRQNHTVLISSELFGATTEPNQTFWSLHQLFAPLAELTVVMVHRHTMDWLASMYARPCRPAPVGSPP